MNKYIMVLAGILFLSAAAAPPVRAKTLDETILIVDQAAMTKGEMEEGIQAYFLAQGLKSVAQPGTPDYEKAKKDVFESFIQEVLLSEEADRQKMEVSDAEIDHQVDQEIATMKKNFDGEKAFEDGLKKEGITLEDLKQDTRDKLARRMKADRMLRSKQEQLPGSAVVEDADVQKYFQKHPQDYERVKFSIILLRLPAKAKPENTAQVEKQAKKLLQELKEGADFASYAKKFSEDQGSSDKGGEVGTVYRTELDPKLAKGVFAIPAKGMGLVRAPDGVYIVKVDYKGKADYDSVAPAIKDHLAKEQQTTALQSWMEGLKKNAYIVEDGKVITEASKPLSPGEIASAAAAQSQDEDTEAAGQTTNAASAEPIAEEQGNSRDNPTLPSGGSSALAFHLNGLNYGTDDLSSYYGSSVNTNQGFPFGLGLDLGWEIAVDQTIEVGILGDVLHEFEEDLTDSSGNKNEWNSTAAGPLLSARVLIPLDEGTNFILSAAGGYYFLMSGSVSVTGSAPRNIDLSGGSFGGRAGLGTEFFLDDDKNTSLDLGLAYRLVKFSSLTAKTTTGTLLPTPGSIDFSGIQIGVGIRFYLDKDLE